MIGLTYNMPQIAVSSCVEACWRRIVTNLSALRVIGMRDVLPLGASFPDPLINLLAFLFFSTKYLYLSLLRTEYDIRRFVNTYRFELSRYVVC